MRAGLVQKAESDVDRLFGPTTTVCPAPAELQAARTKLSQTVYHPRPVRVARHLPLANTVQRHRTKVTRNKFCGGASVVWPLSRPRR